MNNKELKAMVASRATIASGFKFYKSYIKNVYLVEVRPIKGHVEGFCERDFYFEYKGIPYRINEFICANKEGSFIYSAKFRYELIELKVLDNYLSDYYLCYSGKDALMKIKSYYKSGINALLVCFDCHNNLKVLGSFLKSGVLYPEDAFKILDLDYNLLSDYEYDTLSILELY